MSGLGAVVARTPGGREVASSILVAPTIDIYLDLFYNMSFIFPLVADANRHLDDGGHFINEVIAPVNSFFSKHLNIDWEINTVITTSLPWLLIPEDGVGGKTYASDFLVLAVSQKDTTVAKASEMLAHELAHAVRWGRNSEWCRDLFCELVNEGLAVHIEAKFAEAQGERTFFLKTILGRSEKESRRLFEDLRPEFAAGKYDYDAIFFGSDKRLRWAGYCVGYYIVEEYLRKTGKSVFDAVGDLYEDFRVHVA